MWCGGVNRKIVVVNSCRNISLVAGISLQAESRERMLLVPRALSKIGTQGAEHARTLETSGTTHPKKTPFSKTAVGERDGCWLLLRGSATIYC